MKGNLRPSCRSGDMLGMNLLVYLELSHQNLFDLSNSIRLESCQIYQKLQILKYYFHCNRSSLTDGLNAQISVIKVANKHLCTPNHNHVENYNDYDYNHSYQAVCVCPVSCVP
ncbi:hypothetical protein AAZX31_15G170600 [Glycine max]